MQRLIWTIMLCAVLVVPCAADTDVGVLGGGSVSAPAGCTESNDSVQSSATDTSSNTNLQSAIAWKAQGFTLASAITATGVEMYLGDQETASGSFTMSVQTNSSGHPSGTDVSGASVTLTSAATPTGPGWVWFGFSSPVELSATTYHLVLRSDALQGTYQVAMYFQDGVGSLYNYSGDSGSSWTGYSATVAYRVYGCEP